MASRPVNENCLALLAWRLSLPVHPPHSVRYEISCGLQHPIPGFPKVLGWRASDLPKLPEDYPSEFKDLLQVHSYVLFAAECDVLFKPPAVVAVGCWYGRPHWLHGSLWLGRSFPIQRVSGSVCCV